MVAMKLVWTLFLLASTYGSGSYNGSTYNGSSGGAPTLVAIGPVTLPDTGAGWAVLIGAAALAISGGWFVWLWQRRRHLSAHV